MATAFNGVVTVGTSSVEVLDVNTNTGVSPTLVFLSNLSSHDIFLSLGKDAAVVDSGILLASKGSATIDTYRVNVKEIHAISGTADCKLGVSYI